MGKKRKFEDAIHPAEKEASMFRYAELQRACIVRGIDFQKLVHATAPQLHAWFVDNFYEKIDNSRLDAFDEWREEIMRKRGLDEPFIRLGFIGEKDTETGEVISIKRPKKFKKPKKKKRERNEEFGIFSGTKKELTFRCVKDDMSLEKTIKVVTDKFPDAKPKSIGIWYKKARKAKE
jgi:hypothetical protein